MKDNSWIYVLVVGLLTVVVLVWAVWAIAPRSPSLISTTADMKYKMECEGGAINSFHRCENVEAVCYLRNGNLSCFPKESK